MTVKVSVCIPGFGRTTFFEFARSNLTGMSSSEILEPVRLEMQKQIDLELAEARGDSSQEIESRITFATHGSQDESAENRLLRFQEFFDEAFDNFAEQLKNDQLRLDFTKPTSTTRSAIKSINSPNGSSIFSSKV